MAQSQPRLLRLKKYVSNVITGKAFSFIISRLFRNTIPYRGLRLNVVDVGLAPAVKAAIFWGLYESAECRFVHSHLDPSLDVVELGSGIGAISSHIARRLNGGMRLICVEANSRLLTTLKKNLATHGSHLDVQCVNGAIAYENDAVAFDLSECHLTSAIQGTNRASREASVEQVPAISLTEIVDRYGLESYQLVADVEGAEAFICQHDSSALTGCRQIIIELHNVKVGCSVIDIDALLDAFIALGFDVVAKYGPVAVLRKDLNEMKNNFATIGHRAKS